MGTYVLLSLLTGARTEELRALTWGHVDLDGPVAIDLDGGTWRSALAGHRPVFGYAALERQVQTAATLREFLEPLLAYGGCVEALRAAVEEAAAPSLAAAAQFDNAVKQARNTVSTVDAERHHLDEVEAAETSLHARLTGPSHALHAAAAGRFAAWPARPRGRNPGYGRPG